MIEMKLVSAFVLGLMSSTHCLGMCGGISVAFGITGQGNTLQKLSCLFANNTGRLLCYSLLGLLLGALGQVFGAAFQSLAFYLRVFSGVMLLAMGLYIAQWWMGLTVLERAGQGLWKKIQPAMKHFQPASRLRNAFMLGLCWGLLPCGLVYSVLVWAASTQVALQAALLMLAFGFGTLPAMVLAGFGGGQLKQFLQNTWVRRAVALAFCASGVWTLFHTLGTHHTVI